jgi:hypothetical protein
LKNSRIEVGKRKRTAVEPVTRLTFENNRIEVGNRKRNSG